MNKKITIAHISDLHCDASPRWQDAVVKIANCLKEINPQILVITGDCVNHPKKSYFKQLHKDLKNTIYQYGLQSDLRVIPVPGNHDYFYLGNRFFNSWNRKKIYDAFEHKLAHPYGSRTRVLVSTLIQYKIAFYPLDSNLSKFTFGFARGGLDSPYSDIKKWDSFYRQICKFKELDFESLKKIVLLHHHPVPIATSSDQEGIERFLTFRGSYQFLQACRLFNIDLIFHGHHHMSNLVNLTYFKNSSNKTITISACAASGKQDNKTTREIKSIIISKVGSVDISSFTLEPHESDFNKKTLISSPTTYYGDIRKIRNKSSFLNGDLDKSSVASISNKTKIITLYNDGQAYVTIALSNIKWNENISIGEKSIKEGIRADLGRISGGLFEFSHCPMTSELGLRKWRNPNLSSTIAPNPEAPEAFTMNFFPLNPVNTSNDCFKLEYFLSNGFALTGREHEERYKDWDKNKPRQEIATISSEYPTDSLELIVQFPDNMYPPVESVYLEATPKEDFSKDLGMDLLYGKIEARKEETDFLLLKEAVRRRPERNEIAVIIKYPQPDLEYSLRWCPPCDCKPLPQEPGCIRKCRSLSSSIFAPESSEKLASIYDSISRFIERIIFPYQGISVFLLGYDWDEKVLQIKKCPPEYTQQIAGDIIIGRGPAGLAFKLREALFWDAGDDGTENGSEIPIYPVEGVIKNFRPVKVFALPLCSPQFISPKNGSVELEEDFVAPAWGCLSMASENENSFKKLGELNVKDKGEAMIKIYKLLNKFIRAQIIKHFPDIF